MKILLINSYFEKGGAEVVFIDSFHGLENYGSNLQCILAASGVSHEKNSCILDSWENHTLLAPFYYIFNFKNIYLLWKQLQKFRPDIIHLHGFLGALSPSILVVIRLWKKLYSIKVVQTVHDYHVVCPNASAYNYSQQKKCLECVGHKFKGKIFFHNCDRRGWVYSIMKGIRSFIANNLVSHQKIVDLFITPSIFLQEQMLKEGIHQDKLFFLRNPLNIKNYDRINKTNTIVYFGRFSKEKNLAFLLEVFHHHFVDHPLCPNLLLIGDGEESENLKTYVMHYHLQERVTFLPFQSREELQNSIAEAKIMVLPSSVYETYGLVIFESILHNIYPITSNHGGLSESIDWVGIGQTFEDDNALQLKEAIEKTLSCYDTYDFQMAQQKIIEKLGLEDYSVALEKLYRQLSVNVR